MESNIKTILREFRRLILESLPADVRVVAEESTGEMKVLAARLGLELLQSERAGISFQEAANDHYNYPLIARVHHGLIDILQHQLPREAIDFIASISSKVTADSSDSLRNAVYGLATNSENPTISVLARFFLYQAIRLNVWVTTWKGGAQLEAIGALDVFDREACLLLNHRLAEKANAESDYHPLNMILVESMMYLHSVYAESISDLRRTSFSTIQLFNHLTDILEKARTMNAANAVLVRHACAVHRGENSKGSVELAALHPLVFPSANSVDQRVHRLRASGASALAKTTEKRFIDIIFEQGIE